MGQVERYGLYVLVLFIFLILGVAIWGDEPNAAVKTHNTSLQSTRDTDRDADETLMEELQNASRNAALLGKFDIVVTSRRGVGAEGFEISGNGGSHTHAGVGLDRVGADDTFHEDVFKILTFQGKLTRAIEADGVSARVFDDIDNLV